MKPFSKKIVIAVASFVVLSYTVLAFPHKYYYVKPGDTLYKISKKIATSPAVLEYNNDSVEESVIKIGDPLVVYSNNSICYTVVKGDTLYDIASTFNTSRAAIESANGLKSEKIQIGEKLLVPITNHRGEYAVKQANLLGDTLHSSTYVVQKGESLIKIAEKFDTTPKKIMSLNSLRRETLYIGEKLQISNVSDGYGIIEPAKTYPFGYETDWPVHFNGVTSPFGLRYHPVLKREIMHSGVDLRAHYTSVYAFAPGKVTFVGELSGYGNIVMIDHGNGYQTRYAHLSKFLCHTGETIKEGERIAISGATGRVTGPHLHFEIRKKGKPLNPMTFYNSSKKR